MENVLFLAKAPAIRGLWHLEKNENPGYALGMGFYELCQRTKSIIKCIAFCSILLANLSAKSKNLKPISLNLTFNLKGKKLPKFTSISISSAFANVQNSQPFNYVINQLHSLCLEIWEFIGSVAKHISVALLVAHYTLEKLIKIIIKIIKFIIDYFKRK